MPSQRAKKRVLETQNGARKSYPQTRPGTGNGEQGTGSREQGTGNRETARAQATAGRPGNGQRGTGNGEQGTRQRARRAGRGTGNGKRPGFGNRDSAKGSGRGSEIVAEEERPAEAVGVEGPQDAPGRDCAKKLFHNPAVCGTAALGCAGYRPSARPGAGVPQVLKQFLIRRRSLGGGSGGAIFRRESGLEVRHHVP